MRTLVIDCATEACSVAIVDADGHASAGEWLMLGRGHAERLVPMIAALPGNGRAPRIAVALGPGSFTGVRVGLAAARALALAWGAQLVGYPTLTLVAAQARAMIGQASVTVAMTGGHGEWFVQKFEENGQSAAAMTSVAPDVAAEKVDTEYVAGSQAASLIARRGTGSALPLWPDARQFGLLPEFSVTSDLNPLYGRAPDARLPSGATTTSAA